MTKATYNLERIPGHIQSITFAKRKPRSDSESAVGVKRMQLWLAVADEHVASVEALFPFLDVQIKAQADGPGCEVRSKRKLGQARVEVRNEAGSVLFESSTAKGDRPRIVIEKEARAVWLVVPIEVAIPRDSVGVLDDYFKADVLVWLANAQADLEDEAEARAREEKRQAKAARKAEKEAAAQGGAA